MAVFMDIAYANLKQVDKSDFGSYSSNTKLRKLFNNLYNANHSKFIEKETYAYMKLGLNDANGNPIYAYFVPNTIDKMQKWRLQGSRTEKEIFALTQTPQPAPEKTPIISEPDDLIPRRKKPNKAHELNPSKNKTNSQPKVISSFDMISVNGEGTIKPFQIAKYTVVQKLYRELMGNNPSHFQDGAEDKRPVENVSWEEAIQFCNALSKNQQLQPVYNLEDNGWIMDSTANGYRLPTQEEWLFAANGGKKTSPFKYSGSNNIQKVAWWQGNDPTSTHDVGDEKKQPNKLGLYDMSGNVWEWCWTERENSHICCGGAYNSSDEELQLSSSKNIKKVDSFVKDQTIGFRLVKSNEEK